MSVSTVTAQDIGDLDMIAVVRVRAATLPTGAAEVTEEAGGAVVVIGEGAAEAAAQLTSARRIWVSEHCDPRWLAEVVGRVRIVLLPGSPDGRDLGPQLAVALQRPFFAHALAVSVDRVVVAHGERSIVDHVPTEAFVATLIPGVRGVAEQGPRAQATETVLLNTPTSGRAGTTNTVAVMAPDASALDLAEADRIVAGGQGLGSKEQFDELAAVGLMFGASLGGTRVASDAGWIPFQRQIGTTGVAVDPRLYLAFAISGATQHTAGLGDPDHIISVNTDPSCPMMALADLAIVSDATEVISALRQRLAH